MAIKSLNTNPSTKNLLALIKPLELDYYDAP